MWLEVASQRLAGIRLWVRGAAPARPLEKWSNGQMVKPSTAAAANVIHWIFVDIA